MPKSTPSLIALLGLVAVAGYQNRGRISEMLSDARQTPQGAGSDRGSASTPAGGGFLSEIGTLFGAGAAGGTLASGLGDLISRFRDTGRGAPADSWISSQANAPLDGAELEAAIGADTLDDLGRKTGLTRDELLSRLTAALPEVVNRFTPNGRLPTDEEAREFS
ncbi:MAG: YidB family protein [Gemmobacter sp.]